MNTEILLNSLEREINKDRKSVTAIHPHAVELCREAVRTIRNLENSLNAEKAYRIELGNQIDEMSDGYP